MSCLPAEPTRQPIDRVEWIAECVRVVPSARLANRPASPWRRQGGISLAISSLVHVAGLASAAWLGQWFELPRLHLQTGRSAHASIEARFSEGELQPRPTDDAVAEVEVTLPRDQRASPNPDMQLSRLDIPRSEQQLPDVTVPAQNDPQGTIVAPAVPQTAPARNEPTPQVDLPVKVLPPSIPRAIEAPQVRVEPIEAAVASAGAVASTAENGAQTVESPQVISNPVPEYPPGALLQRHTGRVVLRVTIDPRGGVSAATILTSSGHDSLDQAALAGVRRWRFEPLPSGSVDRPRMVAVPFRFVLPAE